LWVGVWVRKHQGSSLDLCLSRFVINGRAVKRRARYLLRLSKSSTLTVPRFALSLFTSHIVIIVKIAPEHGATSNHSRWIVLVEIQGIIRNGTLCTRDVLGSLNHSCHLQPQPAIRNQRQLCSVLRTSFRMPAAGIALNPLLDLTA
jgi:hypothetical protein